MILFEIISRIRTASATCRDKEIRPEIPKIVQHGSILEILSDNHNYVQIIVQNCIYFELQPNFNLNAYLKHCGVATNRVVS